jgi:type IV secretion system protein VirD4
MPEYETNDIGLPIGWTGSNEVKPRIGFEETVHSEPSEQLLLHQEEGHLMTIAPTGAGKGVSAVIPAILSHRGPLFIVDVKGENYQVTARHRRGLGHRVVRLDPFGILGPDADTFNPFDILNLPGAEPDCDAEMLADLLCGGVTSFTKDIFWENTGKGLITGLIGSAAEETDPVKRAVGTVIDSLYADDVDYAIAVRLDTHKFENTLARQELCAYLQHESDRCRPSVRSTAQSMLKCLGSKAVRRALSSTSFDLLGWLRGDPIDIYLIFPPDKLDSHRALLRVIVGSLVAVLLRRQVIPENRTLLLLDECAQLGSLGLLKTALTLLRGYGVQVWSFWQDISQLKHLYAADWETVLNNSSVLQVFGLNNGWVAKSVADVLGISVEELLRLRRGQQVLLRPGLDAQVSQKIHYLTNVMFSGRFDDNPRYRKIRGR